MIRQYIELYPESLTAQVVIHGANGARFCNTCVIVYRIVASGKWKNARRADGKSLGVKAFAAALFRHGCGTMLKVVDAEGKL